MDRVDVRPSRAPLTWVVTLPEAGTRFRDLSSPETWELPGVEVRRRSERSIEVEFESEISPGQVWYYSQGVLRNVGDA